MLGLMHMTNATSVLNDTGGIFERKTNVPQAIYRIGKQKDFYVKLHIDRSIKLEANTRRIIPFHFREPFEKELNHLVEMDIIEPRRANTVGFTHCFHHETTRQH